MSAHRPVPLRDRLLSNSPDPVKSSILRESGLGWNASPPTSSTTSMNIVTPLRIAKRDSPQRTTGADVARRTSSSYKHVRNNNLVSKSPFKSQIPTPTATPLTFPGSPRRVSGEKRTRPLSMTEQAENERPFAFKRERRQSKGFQGLIQKEPVTKSPFKCPPSSEEPSAQHTTASPSSRKPIPVFTAPEPVPDMPTGTSPSRSSLVSRRMHGPRSSSGTGSLSRRRRRKTVTFDERCDVVEFDRDEEEEEEVFVSDDDDDCGEEEEEDDFFLGGQPEPEPEPDDSYESVPLDGDASITGIVDAMLRPSTSTPPPNASTDHDERSGKSYYAEHHPSPKSTPPRTSFPSHTSIPASFAFSLPTHAESRPPATPPRPPRSSVSPSTQVPLGRSTHAERGRAVRMTDHPDLERDVEMLPESPSPAKKTTTLVSNVTRNTEDGVPKFEIQVPKDSLGGTEDDPFALPHIKDEKFSLVHVAVPQIKDERLLQIEDGQFSNTSIDPANLSIGHSDISLSELVFHEYEKVREDSTKGNLINMGIGMGLGNLSEPPESSLDTSYSSFSDSDLPVSRPTKGEKQVPEKANSDAIEQADESLSRSRNVDSPRAGSPALASSIPTRIGSPLSTRAASPLLARVGSPAHRGSPLQHSSNASPLTKSPGTSPLVRSSNTCPLTQTHSGNGLSSGGSMTGRQRISREDVQRRLMRKRSAEFVDDEEPNAVEDGNCEVDAREHGERAVREKKAESPLTEPTDHTVELATVETPETNVGARPQIPDISSQDMGMNLDFDFGSKFGRGLDMGGSSGRVEVSQVDVNMDMRSALDRLMDDVAGSSTVPGAAAERIRLRMRHQTPEGEDSIVTNEGDLTNSEGPSPIKPESRLMERAATDSAILSGPGFVGPPVARSASGSTIPPPPPPKDAIRSREEMILERRREARRRELELELEDEDEDDVGHPPPRITAVRNTLEVGGGRPSRRRSMSTGDAEVLSGAAKKRGAIMRGTDGGLLEGVVPFESQEDPLSDSIDRELRKLETPGKNRYQIREHVGTIYASSDADRISHMNSAGDVDGGKAWRTVRRPSDMNEYSKQIKEFRAQEKPGKAHGKVFVKVLGMKNMNLPMPQEATAVTCTLNNGIHFVTTPECRLGRDFRIDQEFELIEHSKLEFTLTLKVRRDPHIISQFKALAPVQQPVPPPVMPAPSKGGMRSFFSSSPKKPKEKIVVQPPPVQPQAPLPENLARYLKLDGTLARAFISFKDVVHRCDSRLFETSYPLIGQKMAAGNNGAAMQVGEIVLQMFRLPPLPGIAPDELPQSLEECHRGLRHINWHKVTYFEGILTQIGGDCSSWRRRQLRVIGSNLVAFNDVTKKATVTIDLKKATAVEDDQANILNPASKKTRSRYTDEYDGLYGVERSFRLIFAHDQEIVFFADTDEEKAKWLEVLYALVGHIPPHPLWAELLWQRQDEAAKRKVHAAGDPSRSARPASQSAPARPQQR